MQAPDVNYLFQSDSDLERQRSRSARQNYDVGNAIRIPSKVLCMCVVENGEYAFVGESGASARKINLSTGKTSKLFKGHTGPVASLALYISRDGVDILITGSWDKTIKIWDIKTTTCLNTLTAHTDFVKSLFIHPTTHNLYSGSSDKTIREWDLSTGANLRTFKHHTRGITDFAISEDGQYLFSASSDRTIGKWDLKTGSLKEEMIGHETSVYWVRIVEDEMWTASADKTAKRWSLATGKPDTVFQHPDFVKCVLVHGGYVITGGRDEFVRIWNTATAELITIVEGHFDEITSIAIVDNTLYSASLDCSIRKWSILPKDILALKKENEMSAAQRKEKEEMKPIANGLTEEEEQELAELMGDDED